MDHGSSARVPSSKELVMSLHADDMRRSVQIFDQVGEVVSYLRSRGVASSSDHGKILAVLVELPIRQTSGRVTVSQAARLLYMSRRTLSRQCLKAGLPNPHRVLCFARVLGTLRLMRATGWSVGRAAGETGWPDPFSFSNAVQRMTGLRPSTARAKGPLFVAEAWLQRELLQGNLVLREPEAPPCPSCGRQLWPGDNDRVTAYHP